jgi:hypothetical protein
VTDEVYWYTLEKETKREGERRRERQRAGDAKRMRSQEETKRGK